MQEAQPRRQPGVPVFTPVYELHLSVAETFPPNVGVGAGGLLASVPVLYLRLFTVL